MSWIVARVGLILACVAVAGAAVPAAADVVAWLYDGDVRVASQSDVERRRAGGAALVEIMARVTGLREIPFAPAVNQAIRDAERYYVRYGYARRRIEPAEEPDGETWERLQIRFERTAVLDLVRRSGLPVWSADRPTLLVWTVLERGGSREIVADATAEVVLAMHGQARRRGIELTFPLLDLEDRGLLTTDLHGRFWTAIMHASRRYGADLVLLGRLTKEPGGQWASTWELRYLDGENALGTTFAHLGSSAASAAGEAVHRAVDAMAQRFAVRGGDLGSVALTVRGAQTVRAYAALLAYLQSREYVDRVDVTTVEPDALHFRLHSQSGHDQLLELLSMGGYLSVSRSASAVSSMAAPRLELTWMGAR